MITDMKTQSLLESFGGCDDEFTNGDPTTTGVKSMYIGSAEEQQRPTDTRRRATIPKRMPREPHPPIIYVY
jgi:hypothetical protein